MPLYNNGNNIDEESWLPPQPDKQRNRISNKPSTDDLHYFISRNSKEEIAYMYSKMMMMRGGDKLDYDMDYENLEIYEVQVSEVLQFFIDPQEMVITEAYYVLSEGLGINLDSLLVKDLYEYSMWHPNAIVCHVCRKINWTYEQKHFYDVGAIRCNACKQNNRQCPKEGRRLDINFETFQLPHDR